jgi:hypothetical protein
MEVAAAKVVVAAEVAAEVVEVAEVEVVEVAAAELRGCCSCVTISIRMRGLVRGALVRVRSPAALVVASR